MSDTAVIWVRFTQDGFHCWPNGPEYLANRHRHLFYVEVEVPLTIDNDRTIEFHELLTSAKTVMRDITPTPVAYDYGDWSCETIAWNLGVRLCRLYQRTVAVTVSEDNECGAKVNVSTDEVLTD